MKANNAKHSKLVELPLLRHSTSKRGGVILQRSRAHTGQVETHSEPTGTSIVTMAREGHDDPEQQRSDRDTAEQWRSVLPSSYWHYHLHSTGWLDEAGVTSFTMSVLLQATVSQLICTRLHITFNIPHSTNYWVTWCLALSTNHHHYYIIDLKHWWMDGWLGFNGTLSMH